MTNSKLFTLKHAVIFGIAMVVMASAVASTIVQSEIHNLSETRDLLGTYATITAISSDKIMAEGAMTLAFEEIDRLEGILSTYKNSTSMHALNRDGFLSDAEQEILFVFEKSKHYSDLSDGYFDMTIAPILELYGRNFEEYGKSPTYTQIQETLELVNYKNIEVNDGTILFKKEGMNVTLDGIAKGYIIDKAIQVLKQEGIDNALVDVGGDIRTMGKSDGEKYWKIALQNPRDDGEFISIINISDKAIATSGDYEQYFTKDKSAHHILNPKTGHSATESISVTIITDNSVDADALATAVFVMGPQNGMNLINDLENVEGLIVTENKAILKSDNFSDFES